MTHTDNATRFLELIRRSQRGKFKIYIGMIAGVGKTCRMLRDAHDLMRSGIDVQIGYVETHGRKETEELLEGLPMIPRKKVFYKGKEIEEMDVDAILRIHPEIVIVDELAHSNIEGCRNGKRWQDVMNLLDAGINVIAALNIQHIESLHDEVSDVVGISITERVPDHVLGAADEIVNIDLTADELINRLKAGKIYAKEKVEFALNNFFNPEHILYLRELALREVAFRVAKKIEGESFQTETPKHTRLLVCVSSNEQTQVRIIRRAARLAEQRNAELVALYVQTEKESTLRIPLSQQRHLLKHLELAMQLGGRIVQKQADSVTDAIIATCKEEQPGMVCMGHPDFRFPKVMWRVFKYKRMLDFLKQNHMDFVIISV